MRRLAAAAACAAPLLVLPTNAFASTGVTSLTSSTGTAAGDLTSAVSAPTSTVSTATADVTPAVATPTTSSSSTSSSSSTATPDLTTAVTTAVSTATTAVSTATTSAPARTTSAPSAPAAPTDATTTSTPAPDGTAEAYAAHIAGVVGVSHTQAKAGPSGGAATANPLELGDSPAVGGSAPGKDSKNQPTPESSGTLLGAGDNPLEPLGLALMPYDAKTVTKDGATSSSASASILTLLIPSAVFLDVLHSESSATYTPGSGDTPATSTGSTTSYGAHLVVGSDDPNAQCDTNCLSLYLLYAHTDTSGKGDVSKLASLNGNDIGTNSDVNGNCEIPLNPLIDLICLSASGGTGGTGATSGLQQGSAAVLTATSQAGLPDIGLITGQSTSAAGSAVKPQTTTTPPGSGNQTDQGSAPDQGAQAPDQATESGNGTESANGTESGTGAEAGNGTEVSPASAGKTAAGAANGSLPFTGFNSALAGLVGLLLAASGVVLRRTRRSSA